jgi:hypothetical protein
MYYFLAYYRLTNLNIRFIRYLLALTVVFLFLLPPSSILWHQKIGDLFQKQLTKIVGFYTRETQFCQIFSNFRGKNDKIFFEQKSLTLECRTKKETPQKNSQKIMENKLKMGSYSLERKQDTCCMAVVLAVVVLFV